MVRSRNAGLLKMHVNLREQQLKTTTYCVEIAIYKPHVNHKPKIYNRYTQKRKESKLNTKDNLQIRGEESKRGRKEQKSYKNNPQMNKMAISTYHSWVFIQRKRTHEMEKIH